MLEARIEIPDKIAAEGFKRAMTPSAVPQIASYYGNKLALLWVIIAIVDGLAGSGELIFYHLLTMIGVWIAASVLRYLEWSKEIARTPGWSFEVSLDDDGVTITRDTTDVKRRVGWSFYKNYVEYDKYLQIEDRDGNFSFLPKTPELLKVIEFTKEKIPEK
jgi:hypothetical protein